MAGSEWDEEDIVPLGELRPSREAFGPIPNAKQKRNPPAPRSQQGRSGGQRNKAQRPAPRELPAGRPAAARRAPESPRALPAGSPEAPAARQSQGRPQPKGRPQPQAQGKTPAQAKAPGQRQAPQGKGANGRPAPRGQQRNAPAKRSAAPGRPDQFANRLAEVNRAPMSVKPSSGWRGALLKGTFGVVNVGLSATERQALDYRAKVRRPVENGTVAVFSRKGGVGKTTISAYLGVTLASERGGRIVALDGDAEAGSLGWLLAPKAPSTLAALASADPIPSDYAALRRYTNPTPEGLEVIVGDPAEMGPISNLGLEAVAGQLARHYDVSIFDTGAGVTRATGKVLVNTAKVLLLVMGTSVDSVRAAERTLAWLDERPGEAADPNVRVVAVINGIAPDTKASHIDRIESHFANRCDAVVRIPWDPFLAAGSSSVSLESLAKPTRHAFLELAATTIGTLARSNRSANLGKRRAS